MKKSNAIKVCLSVALLAGAGLLLFRFLSHGDGISEKTYFYDLSEKKLFAASREELPPIRGLNDAEEDAVRAIVISLNGDPNDKASRKIAYLEKYAPELKQHLQKMRQGQVEAMPRGSRDKYRFVKRVEDSQWYPVNTPEAQKIMGEWNVPASNGKYPVACAP
jgi:hypothetical protein